MEQAYLLSFHKEDIIRILNDENTLKHFSVYVNFIVLYEHHPKLVIELLKEPEKCLKIWDRAVIDAQINVLKNIDSELNLKNNVHCRIYQLPGFSGMCKTFFPGDEDAGNFLQVSGTVMSISPIKLLQYQRRYICAKCKYPIIVKAEYERRYVIKQPKKCENPIICPGIVFVQDGEINCDYCKDYQEIKIQEQIKKLAVGSIPNIMWVTLEDDLVDSCRPGDNVTICGIVKRRWGEFSNGCKINIDTVLKANNVQVNKNSSSVSSSTTELQEIFSTYWNKYAKDPYAGRNLILKSICPQIYGLYLVKLAIATVLAGGCQMEDTSYTGVYTRAESHILLAGDPGTGKSELLRFISKIIPHSVLTTGVGSTAAGLTVAAVMENGGWQLEGGAMVMSNGGVCCIDEFNSMKEHDRTSIHEAMEQQTISIAKASVICKFNTRCSVLATCNPKATLDQFNPLCLNIALPSPLLSRFDLIILLRDNINEEWDSHMAEYILNGKNRYSKFKDEGYWNIDILQSYFNIIKKIKPRLSDNAEIILSRYYHIQRKITSRNKARTTIRLLESLIRLSQGHARIMFHNEVDIIDSVYAVILVDMAMDSVSSIFNLNIDTRSSFPNSAKNHNFDIVKQVLTGLELENVLKEVIINDVDAENISRFFSPQSEMGVEKKVNTYGSKEFKKLNPLNKNNMDECKTNHLKSDQLVLQEHQEDRNLAFEKEDQFYNKINQFKTNNKENVNRNIKTMSVTAVGDVADVKADTNFVNEDMKALMLIPNTDDLFEINLSVD